MKLTEPSKNAVNNRDGLLDKLENINCPDKAEWIRKLSIDIDQAQDVDVNDDPTWDLLCNISVDEASFSEAF